MTGAEERDAGIFPCAFSVLTIWTADASLVHAQSYTVRNSEAHTVQPFLSSRDALKQ
jgi:hypothetical protein